MLALRIPLCITLLLIGALPLELAFGDQAVSRDAAATGGRMLPGSATEIVTDEEVLTSEVVPPDERFIDRAKLAFEESELVFVRSLNNARFFYQWRFWAIPISATRWSARRAGLPTPPASAIG